MVPTSKKALEKLERKLKHNKDESWALKKAKSISNTVIKNQTTFEEYEAVIMGQSPCEKRMAGITSKLHQVSTTIQSKVAFTFFDDKADWLPRQEQELDPRMRHAGIFSHPHGYML
jgi:hypothetical protein